MKQDKVAILRAQCVLSKLKDRVQGTYGNSVDRNFVLEQVQEALGHLSPIVKEIESQQRLMEMF